MSEISREGVKRLAGLAHISLSDTEIDVFAKQLDVIVDAVSMVQDAANSKVPATSHPLPLRNVLREDVVGETLDRAIVLGQAPDCQDNRFKVPAILEES